MKVNVNMRVKLASGVILLAMLNAPAARSQNSPPPTPARSPASSPSSPSGAQTSGTAPANPATPPAEQEATTLPAYLLSANSSPDMMPRRYIEMWNTGNLGLMNGMFTRHPRLHYPAISSLAMYPSLVAGRVKFWRNCVPDINYQILDTIVQGDKVVLRLVYTGTYEKQCYSDIPAPTPGAPPVKIHVNEVLIFGLDHGEISDIWEQDDQLGARVQMGAKWCNSTQPAAEPSAQPPAATSPISPPSSPAPASPPSKP